MSSGSRKQGWFTCFLLPLSLFFLVPPTAAQQVAPSPSPFAAERERPAAERPAPSPSPGTETEPTSGHRFWDKSNLWLFSGIAATRSLDYASTMNFLARGRKEILLPGEVVHNHAGFAALEAAGTATSVGVSYLFHRTGHHKLERWLSIGHIGAATFGDGRNYALKTYHTSH